MKFFLGVLFLIVFTITLPYISADSMAAGGGWKKYTDFEEYNPGPFPAGDDKFVEGNECANNPTGNRVAVIDIEDDSGNNRVKFTYLGLAPDHSCYLKFNDCPERIVGIKADVTIVSCEGNQHCLGRVVWHRGTTSEDNFYIFEAIMLRPNQSDYNQGYISTQASILDQNNLDPNDDYTWIADSYWAEFQTWINPIGETYTVSAIFDKPDQATVTVEGQGTLTYKANGKIGDPIEIFKGIGMRVWSGDDWTGNPRITDGDFVIYFDNIYVKTKGSCDTKKPQAKKIDPKNNALRDTCWVNITFSEPMDTCCENLTASGDWPLGDRTWSNDQKTLTIERSNCGVDLLPPNTTIEFTINDPGGMGMFVDLKGNEAKKKTLKIKTVR